MTYDPAGARDRILGRLVPRESPKPERPLLGMTRAEVDAFGRKLFAHHAATQRIAADRQSITAMFGDTK